MANCKDKGRNDLGNCKEYKDKGHDECRYEDQGYGSCDKWDQECCDWWPCSWACKIVTWICAAWIWISNVVCVAYYWVANVICVAWAVVVYFACMIVDTAVTALGAVVTGIESVLGWFLDVIGWFVDLFLSIPIIGRLLKLAWNGVLTVIAVLASAADAGLYLIGVRGEKKLRVCTILFCDEHGNEDTIAKRQHIVNELNKAIDVFRQAHVRIVRSAPFQFRSGFGSGERADESWITRYCPQGGNSKDILDVECEIMGGLDDLWTTGSQLQFILGTNCFFGHFRRLVGYGSPVTVFVVRDVSGNDAGGCGSVLWDYVTVEVKEISTFDRGTKTRRTIAHELGHACSLFHIDLSGNLMKSDNADLANDTDLTIWQQILIRTSRHVSYL